RSIACWGDSAAGPEGGFFPKVAGLRAGWQPGWTPTTPTFLSALACISHWLRLCRFLLLCLVFFAGRDDSSATQVRRRQEHSPVRQHWVPLNRGYRGSLPLWASRGNRLSMDVRKWSRTRVGMQRTTNVNEFRYSRRRARSLMSVRFDP